MQPKFAWHISVSGKTYRLLRAASKAAGVPMRRLVEEAIEPVLSGAEPLADDLVGEGRNGCRATGPLRTPQTSAPQDPADIERRIMLDQLAARRDILDRVKSAQPEVALRSKVAMRVSPELALALDDQVARSRDAGVETEPGDHLEAALRRMLATLEVTPLCRDCCEALGDCTCHRLGATYR